MILLQILLAVVVVVEILNFFYARQEDKRYDKWQVRKQLSYSEGLKKWQEMERNDD